VAEGSDSGHGGSAVQVMFMKGPLSGAGEVGARDGVLPAALA
jgi:hypothetical protein